MIRPSGDTAVASVISNPAPERAKLPRWIRCQSVARPSSAEYWHMGAMMMRFGRSSDPRRIGWNNWLMETISARCDRSGTIAPPLARAADLAHPRECQVVRRPADSDVDPRRFDVKTRQSRTTASGSTFSAPEGKAGRLSIPSFSED